MLSFTDIFFLLLLIQSIYTTPSSKILPAIAADCKSVYFNPKPYFCAIVANRIRNVPFFTIGPHSLARTLHRKKREMDTR